VLGLVQLVERSSFDGSCGRVGRRRSEPGFEHEQRFFVIQREQLFEPTQSQKERSFFKSQAIALQRRLLRLELPLLRVEHLHRSPWRPLLHHQRRKQTIWRLTLR
jgi:hypothetical protein